MKRLVIALAFFSLCIPSSPQEIRHQAVAINIEVPVRVFQGETFIDDLTLADFELYENGTLQEIEAVYLIKKTAIEKEDLRPVPEAGARKFSPQVESRYFVLLFDIVTFLPRVEQALNLFFDRVLLPQDRLMIITAVNVYHLQKNSWEYQDKMDLYEQFKGIIRKDTVMGCSEYRENLKTLERLSTRITNLALGANRQGFVSLDAGETGGSAADRIDYYLGRYATVLESMERNRIVDQKKLLQFAGELGKIPGQKNVFLFYQKEFMPQPRPRIIYLLQYQFDQRQDLYFTLHDLFDMYVRNTNLDAQKIKQAYSDSSIAIHFLFLSIGPKEPVQNVYYKEQTEDVFNAFYQLSSATGGYTTASANALWAFNNAVEAAEKYYLLYYTPKNYTPDGKFRNIKVRVKGRNYRVLHRAGYVAD